MRRCKQVSKNRYPFQSLKYRFAPLPVPPETRSSSWSRLEQTTQPSSGSRRGQQDQHVHGSMVPGSLLWIPNSFILVTQNSSRLLQACASGLTEFPLCQSASQILSASKEHQWYLSGNEDDKKYSGPFCSGKLFLIVFCSERSDKKSTPRNFSVFCLTHLSS